MKLNDTENRVMTLDELKEAAVYMQEILRLQDWRLELIIGRGPHRFPFGGHREALTDNDNAQCFINRHKKAALVKVVAAIDYADEYEPQDMLRSLAHELLHLHIEPIMPKLDDVERYIQAECAINMIAYALVALIRQHFGKQNAAAE
jgi:hypothetical protein